MSGSSVLVFLQLLPEPLRGWDLRARHRHFLDGLREEELGCVSGDPEIFPEGRG